MGTKHWSGIVRVGDYRIVFHAAGGFEVQEYICRKIGWVEANDTPISELPSDLVEAIRAFRPNYPIDEV